MYSRYKYCRVIIEQLRLVSFPHLPRPRPTHMLCPSIINTQVTDRPDTTLCPSIINSIKHAVDRQAWYHTES